MIQYIQNFSYFLMNEKFRFDYYNSLQLNYVLYTIIVIIFTDMSDNRHINKRFNIPLYVRFSFLSLDWIEKEEKKEERNTPE